MLKRERTFRMKAALCFNVGRVRFSGGVKNTKPMLDAVSGNLSPFSSALRHFSYANQSGPTVGSTGRLVLKVYDLRHVAQVRPSVVEADSFNVVGLKLRPFPVHVKKSQPRRPVVLPVNFDYQIAAERVGSARWSSYADTVCAPYAVGEGAGIRVVVEKLAQTLGSKIDGSHEALQLLIGQRPAAIRSRSRASLFSAHCTSGTTQECIG